MTISKLESLLLFSVLEIAPASDRWAADCRLALYGDAATGGAAAGRLRDKEFRRACLGAAFRRTVLGQFPWQARGGAAWFLDICAAAPAEVLALSAWITPQRPRPITLDLSAMGLTLPGVRILGPGDKEWRSWVDDCSEARFVSTAATSLSDTERGLGEENVIQKAAIPLPKMRRRREAVAAGGGGLF